MTIQVTWIFEVLINNWCHIIVVKVLAESFLNLPDQKCYIDSMSGNLCTWTWCKNLIYIYIYIYIYTTCTHNISIRNRVSTRLWVITLATNVFWANAKIHAWDWCNKLVSKTCENDSKIEKDSTAKNASFTYSFYSDVI